MKLKRQISVIVTDLDNTLFDWFEFWYHSFNGMLERVLEKSKLSREILIPEIKSVHQRHGTSEYAFLLQELPCLRAKHPGDDVAAVYADAIEAYRTARKGHLKLYPDVLETLRTVKETGCLVVGYTESMGFYSNYRVRNLGLDGILDYLYSPADHDLPENLTPEQIRKYPTQHYKLKQTVHRHTPAGELKPNPKVLLDIIVDIGADPSECIYIGDSLMKDVLMAQEVGVID